MLQGFENLSRSSICTSTELASRKFTNGIYVSVYIYIYIYIFFFFFLLSHLLYANYISWRTLHISINRSTSFFIMATKYCISLSKTNSSSEGLWFSVSCYYNNKHPRTYISVYLSEYIHRINFPG